jgi:MinD-like ATPase involved in chromosome partitioning or flagellar assembly
MTIGEGPSYALVLAGGASWEAAVIDALRNAGIVVAKRCVDVPDLMASASSSGATIAIVDGEIPHLDAEVVSHLLRYDVHMLAVTDEPGAGERLARLGVAGTARTDAADVVAALGRIAVHDVPAEPTPVGRHQATPEARSGRVVAVWGPAGSPGRTTVAVGLADGLASSGSHTLLMDADPYGGTVAQARGILDEVSGVLAVARMANLGTLDAEAIVRSCRRVGEKLDVLTGLPRADRRVEVRPGVMTTVLWVARALGDVVVDCGFCLEDADVHRARDRMTLDVVTAADELVVVGSAEPSGLTRLARGLVELRDVTDAPVRVVVNRMRPSLGWSERDVVGMVEGYVRPVAVHFLPEDRATVDRALVAGRALSEVGESALRSGLADVAAAMWPSAPPPEVRRGAQRGPRLRRQVAG